MWQDELIRLNEMGVKYIFSSEQGKTDVLDIGNFADFVKKRDECLVKTLEEYNLRLPEKEESLNEYFSNIDQQSKLKALNKEQDSLLEILSSKKREFELKSTAKEKTTYEK